ncbi:MAG: OmpH family outer membrane protein [Thermodesulfobacteriota bacterium]
MKQINLLTLVCLVFVMVCGNDVVAAEKVGYINLQRLVNESEMGQAAKQEILKLRKEREQSIAAKLQEINRLKDIINDKDSKLSATERRDKLEAFQKAYKDYQRLVADAKEDITREDRQLVSIILDKADGVLKKVAKKQKYAIILKDPNAVGYLDPEVDVTDEVLKELNKK